MDNTNMTILTWNDASVVASEGTIALLVTKEYERYNFADYDIDGTLFHYPAQTPSAIGIADGFGNWDTAIVGPDGFFMCGGQKYPNEDADVLKWAALPFVPTIDNGVKIPKKDIKKNAQRA